MKLIISLVLVASCFVAHLQATDVVVVLYAPKDYDVMNVTFEGKTIAAMKEAFEIKTGIKVEDQRLVNGAKPIIGKELVSELEIEPMYGKPMVVLHTHLGSNGLVYVWKNNGRQYKIHTSGSSTLGEFRKKLRPGKLCFGFFELVDDTKTLDYYQIGAEATLHFANAC